MRVLLPIVVVVGLLTTPALAGAKNEAAKLRQAEKVLDLAVTAPDGGIPQDLLAKAECVGVFPGVAKGAFVVGGEFGRGVFTCRGENGKMGPPAFFSLGGPSVGWQFGGRKTDLVLLIMNKDGVKHLLEDKFTIGGQVSAAAGPVGRTGTASTDAQLQAQILSWSRSRGAFIGASLDGTVIKANDDVNDAFYGTEVSAKKLLIDQSVPVPVTAQSFVDATTQHARRTT